MNMNEEMNIVYNTIDKLFKGFGIYINNDQINDIATRIVNNDDLIGCQPVKSAALEITCKVMNAIVKANSRVE